MKKSMRFVLALCATLAAQAAVPCFTVKLKVDLSGVATNEALYEVGCARLALRIAGQDKNLVSYDNRQGNYLNFPMPDGTHPVIEATLCDRGGRVGIPLGTKWVPEIVPPVSPETFMPQPNQAFRLAFAPESGNGTALTFTIDPAARTATFADDKADAQLEAVHRAGNFRISNLPEFSSAYLVRLVQYWDKKSNATIFDVEIDGLRTMICRRAGKFKNAE